MYNNVFIRIYTLAFSKTDIALPGTVPDLEEARSQFIENFVEQNK